MTRTKATGAGWSHLSGLQKLRSLNLDETAVKDAGLKGLDKLLSLQTLSLRKTAVTDAGLVGSQQYYVRNKLVAAKTRCSFALHDMRWPSDHKGVMTDFEWR